MGKDRLRHRDGIDAIEIEGGPGPGHSSGSAMDAMEELVKFALLTRDIAPYLVDRYSERKESAAELSARVSQGSI